MTTGFEVLKQVEGAGEQLLLVRVPTLKGKWAYCLYPMKKPVKMVAQLNYVRDYLDVADDEILVKPEWISFCERHPDVFVSTRRTRLDGHKALEVYHVREIKPLVSAKDFVMRPRDA
jgi:hypothetical protein